MLILEYLNVFFSWIIYVFVFLDYKWKSWMKNWMVIIEIFIDGRILRLGFVLKNVGGGK